MAVATPRIFAREIRDHKTAANAREREFNLMETQSTEKSTGRIALILVCTTSFITPLMLSGVNVAIPAIAADFHADAVLLSWIPTAYLLATAVFLLPAGRLGDLVGRKKMYVAGIAVMALGSALAAAAGDIRFLLGCRVIQGMGNSLMATSGIPMLVSIFPSHRRGSVVGMTTAGVYVGLTGGPLIGGLCTHYLSWRAIFLIHIPVLLTVIFLTLKKLHGEWSGESEQRFDFKGAVIFAAGISALIYGLSLLPALHSIWLILLGLSLLTGFFQLEKRMRDPILDVRLFFENRLFLFSSLAALFLYSASFGLSYLMSLYLQYIKAMSADTAGMVLMSQPVMMAALSPFTGRLSDRIEPRLLASAGLILNVTGYFLLSRSGMDTPLIYIILCLFTTGIGFALFSSPNINAILGAVRREQLGIASGITSTMRVLGQMFSMAVITTVFAVNMGRVQITPELYPVLLHNVQVCLVIASGLAMIALLSSLSRGDLH
jgi:EmrB/QacA subfamily drug resistance transporter